ncbi:MAG: hypothetical protein JO013_00755 [Alphaproteobacteria bacterium]|nr:hypothetical protein [Alphaproteobacteria bacterium]
MRIFGLRTCLPAIGLASALCAAPAAAQTAPTDIDTLIGASLSPDTGMTLARAQISDRDLLGAAGTLERVLLAHPEALPPRLLYASLLCRLDDREGAEVEIGLLGGQPIADADWAEVTGACGAIARPAPPRGKRR